MNYWNFIDVTSTGTMLWVLSLAGVILTIISIIIWIFMLFSKSGLKNNPIKKARQELVEAEKEYATQKKNAIDENTVSEIDVYRAESKFNDLISKKRFVLIAPFVTLIIIVPSLFGILNLHPPQEPRNAEGDTKTESFRNWADEQFGIEFTEDAAKKLVGIYRDSDTEVPAATTVDYKGHLISVSVSPYGGKDDSYTLVNNTTSTPLESSD